MYCTVLYLILLRGGMPRMGSPSMVRVPFSKLRIALTQLSFVLHANIFTPHSRYFCPRTCTRSCRLSSWSCRSAAPAACWGSGPSWRRTAHGGRAWTCPPAPPGHHYHYNQDHNLLKVLILELQTINRRSCTITEKVPSRVFSWLKVVTTAFTFKTLLRHYAQWALTPR